MEVDIFNSGKPKNGHKDISQFLLVCFVVLRGEIGLFPSVLGKIRPGHLSNFLNQGEYEDRAEFLGIPLSLVRVA